MHIHIKCTILLLASFLTVTSCVSKPTSPAVEEQSEQNTADDDQVICTAIKNFLCGKADAAVLTRSAKADLTESTWPEVYCSVEGMLDAPSSFKNLTVRKVGEGQYKYECVCPDHGDRFVDCCTIHAVIDDDGVVKITHITWDDTAALSVGDLLKDNHLQQQPGHRLLGLCDRRQSLVYEEEGPQWRLCGSRLHPRLDLSQGDAGRCKALRRYRKEVVAPLTRGDVG